MTVSGDRLPRPFLHPLRALAHRFEAVHMLLGLFGNTAFFVGSIFFFWKSWETAGVWLFVFGSAGMLIGSVGAALVRWHVRGGHGT